MGTFYLLCAGLGGVVIVGQVVLSMLGVIEHDHHPDVDGAEEGLNLFSVRALGGGLAFFGIGGLAGLWLGLSFLSLLVAAVAGVATTVAVAMVTRSLVRLESDRTSRLAMAIGEVGTVYLTIPGGRLGIGKVHVSYDGRLAEVAAITSDSEIATGERVMIVDIEGDDTVVVSRAS
jgi:membrane protein implicated in regulation of membrane protease activity